MVGLGSNPISRPIHRDPWSALFVPINRRGRSRKMSICDQLLAEIQAQYDECPAPPPVVTLDDYFKGNSDEGCAPIQVGFGRPSLAELYARFKVIQQKPNVQAVLVGIHGDWTEAFKYPESWPAAENVHIYTTATAEEVEAWISGLEADGAIEGWPYGMHPSAPQPNPGYQVFSVCWD
jgi:hypothetical protein